MKHTLLFLLTLILFACQKEKETTTANREETLFNLSYGADATQKLDLYLPAGRSADSTKLLVLIHGGAWSAGDKDDFKNELPGIKQKLPAYAIANINYRLATAGSNAFPAQELDVKAALQYLLQQRQTHRYSDKLALLGVSSGAHLAKLQAYKNPSPRVFAVVDFFGPSDMVALYNESNDPFVKNGLQIILNGTPATQPGRYQESSPVQFVSATSPPTLMLHGGKDTLVRPSQAMALQRQLQTAGVAHELVIYPNEGHDFWSAGSLADAYDRIERFLKTHVK